MFVEAQKVMNLSEWIYIFILFDTVAVFAGTIQKIDTLNSQPAIKGTSIRLVCYISQFSNQDLVIIYKSDSRVLTGSLPDPSDTKCVPSVCLITASGRYTYSADSGQVYINIENLNRSEDQKWWTCVLGSQRKDVYLTIYTVPQTLQLDSPPSQDQDLAENAVTLRCSTGCTYPHPSFKWFFTEFGGSRQEWSTLGSDTGTTGECTDLENIYTSTLSLAKYSTFPGNLNKTVKFTCGIPTFTGMTQPLYTNPSVNIQFAVPATTPKLTNQTAGILAMMENDSVSMECISSSTRPVAMVTWKKGAQLLTNVQNINSTTSDGLMSVRSIVKFTPVRIDNNENIYCETAIPGQQNKFIIQQRITVYWPPSAPSIPTNDFPFLEGQSGKTLSCSSNEYGNPRSSATWNSNYGTQDTSDSKILNLPMLNKDIDKSNVSCQLKNNFTQAKGLAVTSPTIIIDIQYKPVVQIMVGGQSIQNITKIEGENLAAHCSAVGNPVPRVNWIGQTSTGSELRFNDTDRKDYGTYTCRAEATSEKYRDHDFVTLRNLSVVVFYAPNVSVNLSIAEPTENSTLMITCNAIGRPNNFTYISMIQTWNGITIPNTHQQNNGIVDIKNLQLQDSGIYKCKVKNGIPDRNQQIDQTGKSEVSVKVSPKVLLEGNYRFAGAPGKSVNITIPFYSFPDISSVMFKFPNGSEIRESAKYEISFMKSNVTDRFYGQQVELEGYIAVLQIKDEDEADFLNYTLVLDNGIGKSEEWTVYHVSESIPSVPTLLNFTGIVDGVPTFLLQGSFNGGRPQYFRIETSILGMENWKEHLKFSETDKEFLQNKKLTFHFNVTDLTPNTYEIRVLAGNDLGWIENKDAPVTTFTV